MRYNKIYISEPGRLVLSSQTTLECLILQFKKFLKEYSCVALKPISGKRDYYA
jgi:hypothetical protein